jgi:hypothetical protein
MSPVLTLAEVAAHFRVPEKFIRRLASTRQVPCLRGTRGKYLFTEVHVAAIEDHLTQQAEVLQPVSMRGRRSA